MNSNDSPSWAPLLSRWDAIIFDLGGVLLNLDYAATTSAFSRLAGRDLSSFYSKTKQYPLFDQFECGAITVAEFRDQLRAVLGVRCEDAVLDQAWNALLLDVPSRNIELLLRLRATHRVFLLSNTNELHLADFVARFEREHGATYGPWSSLFHRDYYSHLLGCRKPEREIFEAVLRTEALDPRRTLFIDDNWHNVQGARAVGLDAAWIDVPRDSAQSPPSDLLELDGAPDIHELFMRVGAAAE